jgi:N-formylglutamate amidohydrolase
MRPLLVIVSLVYGGCSTEDDATTRCDPGGQLECACPNGTFATQTCSADGSSLGPCACGGAPPAAGGVIDSGGVVGGSGGAPGGTGGASPASGGTSGSGGEVGGGVVSTGGVTDAGGGSLPWITVEPGDLPVVLSATHGGTEEIPGVLPRTSGTTVTDVATYELTTAVHEAVARDLGRRPHLVAARVSRRWIDFNRAPAEAFEDPSLAPIYDAFHDALRHAAQSAHQQDASCALLLDVHGQSMSATSSYRGTRSGITASLGKLHDSDAVLDVLADADVGLSPATAGGLENPFFSGGYVVGEYGLTHGAAPVDAVQIEFGSAYRQASTLAHTIDATARAVASHVRTRCPAVLP